MAEHSIFLYFAVYLKILRDLLKECWILELAQALLMFMLGCSDVSSLYFLSLHPVGRHFRHQKYVFYK